MSQAPEWMNELYTPEQKLAAAQDVLFTEFAKVAAAQNINLTDYTPEQVQAGYEDFVAKLAAEESKKEEDEEKRKKLEAAKHEHEEKKAEAAQVAEAATMGRIMAENFQAKLAEDGTLQLLQKLAEGPSLFGKAKDAVGGAAGKAKDAVGGAAGRVADFAKKNKVLTGVGAGVAAAGVGAGVAHKAGLFSKKKEEAKAEEPKAEEPKTASPSNLDQLAFEEAGNIAEAHGLDAKEAMARINAVHTLGQLAESTKVAAAQDLDAAITIRGFEMLESAGYPVSWEKVAELVGG